MFYGEIHTYQQLYQFLHRKAVIKNNDFSGILHAPFLAFLLSSHIMKNPIMFIIIKYRIIFCIEKISCILIICCSILKVPPYCLLLYIVKHNLSIFLFFVNFYVILLLVNYCIKTGGNHYEKK